MYAVSRHLHSLLLVVQSLGALHRVTGVDNWYIEKVQHELVGGHICMISPVSRLSLDSS